MNIRHLIQQRSQLLKQTRLANVAFAYERLGEFGRRIARANLRGSVTVQPADPSIDRLWPEISSDQISAAVLTEHFLDSDIAELADLLAFVCEDQQPTAHTFAIECLADEVGPALLAELRQAGVAVDGHPSSPEDSRRGST